MSAIPSFRPQSRLRTLSPICLLSLLLALPAPADPVKKRSLSDPFEGTTEVVVVEVPVNVTTRDGQPVRGLTAADFEILDEGKKQEITHFEVVDLEVETPSGERARSMRRNDIPPAARRHFLFLFDLSFANPVNILKARRAARQLVLDSLHPSDLAAVATYSLEQGPRLVLTFTPDRAQLALAIDTLGAHFANVTSSVDPLRFIIRELEFQAQDASLQETGATGNLLGLDLEDRLLQHLRILGTQFEKSRKSFERSKVSAWSRALADIAKALNSVQGRKHVVYFSEGFDSRLLLGRGPTGDEDAALQDELNTMQGRLFMVDTDDIYGNATLQRDMEDMLEEFRRADAVIQAVDVGGLRADGDIRGGLRDVGQPALFYMANGTGGELFEDANDLKAELGKVLKRSDLTYLLAFQVADLRHDGAYHRLKVKLKEGLGRGVHISHRKGYYAPRPYDQLHPLEKSLLASDAIASAMPRRDLDMSVLAAPFRANPELAYVPVIIELGGASLLQGHRAERLDVEIYTYVTDQQGEMRDFFTQLVAIDVGRGNNREVLERSGIKYYGHLDLPPGDYLVRVLTRNGSTGRTAVETLPLRVPVYEAAQPVLLPPFFIEQPGAWVMIKEKARDEVYQKSVVYPFTVNGDPYVPAARPALTRHQEAQVCLVAYNLGQGGLALDGRILAEDGRVLEAGKLALVERTVTGIEGLDKLLATFEIDGLEKGRYTLEVSLTDTASGSTQVSTIPFSVAN